MREAFVDWNPTDESLATVRLISGIMESYRRQGFVLTVRQVYYQLVARDAFPPDRKFRRTSSGKWVRDPKGTPNAEPNYKWVIDICSKARLAGLLDWEMIEDRTRGARTLEHWESPSDIVSKCAEWYRFDRWESQPAYCEIWCEKDALSNILLPVAQEYDIPFLSCRGYLSLSAMYDAAKRLEAKALDGRDPVVIFYLGDHDPSGLDMSEGDIPGRIETFFRDTWPLPEVRRIALNRDQIEKYGPPENPAKMTDSRAQDYVSRYGMASWELDALEPRVLYDLASDAIVELIDWDEWEVDEERLEADEKRLQEAAAKLEADE